MVWNLVSAYLSAYNIYVNKVAEKGNRPKKGKIVTFLKMGRYLGIQRFELYKRINHAKELSGFMVALFPSCKVSFKIIHWSNLTLNIKHCVPPHSLYPSRPISSR